MPTPPITTPWVPLWPLDTAVPTSQYLRAETSATLTLTTSAQSVPGCTITFPTPGIWFVVGEFDFIVNATGVGTCVGTLGLTGATLLGAAPQALFTDVATGMRAVICQTWFVQATAAGQTATLQAQKTAAGGTGTTAQPHTCIRAMLVPAVAPLPLSATVPYSTSLPTAPADGQYAVLVDNVTNPTYQWTFRYNAGSTSPYKWEFVGGADAYAEVNTSEATSASTTWLDLATVGPRIIVPRAGDYDALVGCDGSANAQNVWMMIGVAVGATAPPEPLGRLMYAPTIAGYPQHFGTSRRALGVAVGNDLRLRYQSYHSGSSTNFAERWIRVTPVRVS
jgi:hypothetical protein